MSVYVHERHDFMSLSVETQPSLTLGAPKKLFSGPSDWGKELIR